MFDQRRSRVNIYRSGQVFQGIHVPFLNDIFPSLNSSTTIPGVIIKGRPRNLAALMALPSSVASTALFCPAASSRASLSPCEATGARSPHPDMVWGHDFIAPSDASLEIRAASG